MLGPGKADPGACAGCRPQKIRPARRQQRQRRLAHIYTHNVPTLRTHAAHTRAQLAFELRSHEQAPLLPHGGSLSASPCADCAPRLPPAPLERAATQHTNSTDAPRWGTSPSVHPWVLITAAAVVALPCRCRPAAKHARWQRAPRRRVHAYRRDPVARRQSWRRGMRRTQRQQQRRRNMGTTTRHPPRHSGNLATTSNAARPSSSTMPPVAFDTCIRHSWSAKMVHTKCWLWI